MSAAWVAVGCLLVYTLAFRFYARRLAGKIFSLDSNAITPAHQLRDEIDYVPANRYVLFGHHYASITGLSPMLGPAIAVIWGWIPGLLWVVFGAILIGCVHDFGALVLSMRARGQSIGKVTEGIIGQRAKTLFHLIIFFGIALAMGVFVYVVALLFTSAYYPQAVFPSATILALAITMGVLVYKKRVPLGPATAIAFLLTLISVWMGARFPLGGDLTVAQWSLILLGYAFFASVLPVWMLLQPRDFINSLLLYLGLGSMYVGFFLLRPQFVAPAVDFHPPAAPSIFPFVFIVIACGAASGFHALVSSGTTAKQIDKETDARFIGYGGMIGESLLGLMAVLACTAGFASVNAWHQHYANWDTAQGLGRGIGAFISGTSRFVSVLGLAPELASIFVAVIVVSFALTTLDSATRLLRYNIAEIGDTLGLSLLNNRYVSSLVAIGAIAFFAFYKVGGESAGLFLWQLFGTTNQLLAGLTLLVITLYLVQQKKPYFYTLVPMLFMLGSTLTAMVANLQSFWKTGNYPLLTVGSLLFFMALWLTVEAAVSLTGARVEEVSGGVDFRA